MPEIWEYAARGRLQKMGITCTIESIGDDTLESLLFIDSEVNKTISDDQKSQSKRGRG